MNALAFTRSLCCVHVYAVPLSSQVTLTSLKDFLRIVWFLFNIMKARVNLLNSQMLPIVGIIRRALFLKCSSVRGVIKKTLFFRLKIKPRFPDSSLLLFKNESFSMKTN